MKATLLESPRVAIVHLLVFCDVRPLMEQYEMTTCWEVAVLMCVGLRTKKYKLWLKRGPNRRVAISKFLQANEWLIF